LKAKQYASPLLVAARASSRLANGELKERVPIGK